MTGRPHSVSVEEAVCTLLLTRLCGGFGSAVEALGDGDESRGPHVGLGLVTPGPLHRTRADPFWGLDGDLGSPRGNRCGRLHGAPAGLCFRRRLSGGWFQVALVRWLGSVPCAPDFLEDSPGPRAAPASCTHNVLREELWPGRQLILGGHQASELRSALWR